MMMYENEILGSGVSDVAIGLHFVRLDGHFHIACRQKAMAGLDRSRRQ